MMADAERGLFQMLVVKDISRLARNTVDLLQSVRRLKALGIPQPSCMYQRYICRTASASSRSTVRWKQSPGLLR